MGTFFIIHLLTASLAAAGPGRTIPDDSFLREGDIIFHESRSEQATAIKLATRSRYTHVGMLVRHRGKIMVLEAVQPVKISPLGGFIARGENGHFVIKRLREHDRYLTPPVMEKMRKLGRSMIGKDYDYCFEWSDRRIYCTELVWKLYKQAAGIEVGVLQKLGDFDLTHPHVKKIMARRYGTRVPLGEPVISPASMFASPVLETVFER
jgi:hypothetical protein